ncbi:MAG: hypothetical protein AVDCRST_MAG03-971 [uncultured Rubrobacteraceae bacterium]|uniref:Uncharacterized protein n=1 Tax=uncultured Rubrobacteraceae bacterium TaxID=349277 RepID=A0A6J4NTZ1_9ACTN|nr:MAG: hypothetical protein AVDCRST_MAG03-971 [uncultured Rubrobacteraceae bacterium]
MEQNPSGASRRTGGAVSPGLLNELLRVLMRLLNGLLTQANDLADRGGERVKAQWDEQRGGEQVRSRLSDRKHEASQRLAPVETALRETAQQLRRQGQGQVAGYADQASDQVERASDYLRDTDVDEMVDQARGFARRRPALFLGGAATLGFLAARFLKSSSRGASAGQVPGGATGSAALSHGTGEPASTPRGIAEGPGRAAAPAGGQPLEDRYDQVAGRTEPPRGS